MGNVVVSYEYDAWGKVYSVTGSMADTLGQINPIRYRSYYYDNETGLYYLNSRYYDPETGRFINADGIIAGVGNSQGYNLYSYCDNNSVNKVDYILKKLHLEKGMSLLDIGCGWGFLLIEAARKYGVKGTGITLSHEQYKEFQKRIKEQKLEDLLTVELMDYRDLPKSGMTFDRVVSVGMVEHVGRENYPFFVQDAAKALKPGGLFLLHFISSVTEHAGDPWIKRYIFPGGVIPSLREMISAMGDEGFHVLDVENLRLHYNKTLLCWEKNYREHLDQVREMFDERFVRMWDLYLSACAATFHNGIIDLHQILASKGVNNNIPMVRWY